MSEGKERLIPVFSDGMLHVCVACQTTAHYSGLIYVMNVQGDKRHRELVRNCPSCNHFVDLKD